MRHSFITFHFFGFEIFYKNCKTSKETFTYLQSSKKFQNSEFPVTCVIYRTCGTKEISNKFEIPAFKFDDCNNYVISLQNKDP